MKRVPNRKALAIYAAWAASALLCFVLGVRMAPAANNPPPCGFCNCKVITFWVPPAGPMLGAFQTNAQPGINTTDKTAILNLNTGTGGCQNSPLVGNGTYDRWQIPWGGVNCTPPPGNINATELTVTQAQIGVIQNTQQNKPRNTCSP